MNDYTIEAYLNRRSTGQLQIFLRQCMYRKLWEQYTDTIPLVLNILQKRGIEPNAEVLSSWKEFLSRDDR